MSLFHYVGSNDLLEGLASQPRGGRISSPNDIYSWLKASQQILIDGRVTVTFVLDSSAELLIADRRSEHVRCAGGLPVLSAGEITFQVEPNLEIVEISNQSIGYCPNPGSWSHIETTLTTIGIPYPSGWTLACIFRRCPKCQSLNIVKDEVYRCLVCDADLPR